MEIQSGAVAKSKMRKCANISPKEAVSYQYATAPFLNFLIYEENMIFFFISVAKLWRSLVSSFSSPRISFSLFFLSVHLFDAEALELVCHSAGVTTNLISVLALASRKFTEILSKIFPRFSCLCILYNVHTLTIPYKERYHFSHLAVLLQVTNWQFPMKTDLIVSSWPIGFNAPFWPA
jgi:hypothetical protein